MVKAWCLFAVVFAAAFSLSACGREPDGAGAAPHIRWRAEQEGALLIRTNTSMLGPVINAFRVRYPKVKIRLEDMNSTMLANMVVEDVLAGRPGADLVWSSAMDVQIKLINDGYAQTYKSPHRRAMPDGMVWRDQGFGITSEPVVFAYNRRLLPPALTPTSHADLIRLLETRPEIFDGRITVYDAEQSGVALMQLSSDTQIYPDAWRMMEVLGDRKPRLDTSGQRMMSRLAKGQTLFVFNMNQSYGQTWVKDHPDIALVTPTDYHLLVSRVAFIPSNAAHPNAARLFLDFLLSREGQAAVAKAGMRPARDDVAQALRLSPPGARPIRVGPGLLANLDYERREKLLGRWRAAMEGAPRAPLDPHAP